MRPFINKSRKRQAKLVRHVMRDLVTTRKLVDNEAGVRKMLDIMTKWLHKEDGMQTIWCT